LIFCRYWAVTNIDYIHTRNSSRIGAMIVLVWGVALIVSLAPQFGWKDPGYLDRINLQQRCLVSQDVAYQIFATCSTFYVPLLVILVLYWKIFQTARKRIRHRVGKTPALNNCSTPPAKRKKKRKHEALERHSDVDDETRQNTTAFTITAPTTESAPDTPATAAPSNNVSPDKSSTNNGSASHQSHISDASRAEMVQQKEGSGKRKENPSTPATTTPAASSSSTGVATVEQERRDPLRERRDKKESMEAKRERKAAKTLAIITGAFVICWLPFFIMALLMPLCESCSINDYVASFFLWLGYFNSTLNPVIYTIFSPEFRQAFKRILCGSKSRSNYRPRKFR
jgi:5-hydroxytryptamine receptor 1